MWIHIRDHLEAPERGPTPGYFTADNTTENCDKCHTSQKVYSGPSGVSYSPSDFQRVRFLRPPHIPDEPTYPLPAANGNPAHKIIAQNSESILTDTDHTPKVGGIQLVELFSACRCLYYQHAVDRNANYGRPGFEIQRKTLLVGYACALVSWLCLCRAQL